MGFARRAVLFCPRAMRRSRFRRRVPARRSPRGRHRGCRPFQTIVSACWRALAGIRETSRIAAGHAGTPTLHRVRSASKPHAGSASTGNSAAAASRSATEHPAARQGGCEERARAKPARMPQEHESTAMKGGVAGFEWKLHGRVGRDGSAEHRADAIGRPYSEYSVSSNQTNPGLHDACRIRVAACWGVGIRGRPRGKRAVFQVTP
jgi:hypothetical protein